jgi:hypothetical protein
VTIDIASLERDDCRMPARGPGQNDFRPRRRLLQAVAVAQSRGRRGLVAGAAWGIGGPERGIGRLRDAGPGLGPRGGDLVAVELGEVVGHHQ